MNLTPDELRVVRHALSLAIEWESSVQDSLSTCTGEPWDEQRKSSVAAENNFKKLLEKLRRASRQRQVSVG